MHGIRIRKKNRIGNVVEHKGSREPSDERKHSQWNGLGALPLVFVSHKLGRQQPSLFLPSRIHELLSYTAYAVGPSRTHTGAHNTLVRCSLNIFVSSALNMSNVNADIHSCASVWCTNTVRANNDAHIHDGPNVWHFSYRCAVSFNKTVWSEKIHIEQCNIFITEPSSVTIKISDITVALQRESLATHLFRMPGRHLQLEELVKINWTPFDFCSSKKKRKDITKSVVWLLFCCLFGGCVGICSNVSEENQT